MTIEEKVQKLQEYCNKHDSCEHCRLDSTECNWLWDASEEEIDDMLEKAFEEETNNDAVNHPSHYTNGGMECIDEMIMIFGKQAVMNFCLCNVWKYRKRALHKNGQEDLDKADWYMNKYKELKEELANKPFGTLFKEGVTYGA